MKFLRRYMYLPLCAIMLSTACTKLDVPVENALTPENFPLTDQQYLLAQGPVYSQFRSNFATSIWQLETLSTDEAILPARNGGWSDGFRYKQMHYHNWTPDNQIIADSWAWGFGTISNCNYVLTVLNAAPTSATIQTYISEIRLMRAIAMFYMMDAYGNIPVPTVYGDLPKQQTAADAFKFIESEVKAILPTLSTVNDNTNYGRPNKYAGFALLAKLYLNAKTYTGTEHNADAIAACDSVISANKYSVDPNYLKMFYPDNGYQMKEFIFAIPYDQANATGEQFSWYSLHPALQAKYGLSYRLSNPVSTIPSYYANFSLAGDVRNTIWLIGKQYDFQSNPIIIKTTKKGLDATYTGADGSDPVDYQLTFTPDVTLTNVDNFEVGGDELGKAKGIRNNKYYPDVTATSRNQSNDVPVFRYSDILLMKAEAELRSATVTNGQTPDDLINMIRANRSAPVISGAMLDDILPERARELNWEGWRRNDLIRFGKYEDAWGYKTDNNVNRRLFAIPSAELILNPNLKQNAQ